MNRNTNRTKYTLGDGTPAVFSRYKFKTAINKAMNTSEAKVSQQTFLEDLAEATGNSFSAIKHWLSGHNAPSDIEKLQSIADFLDVRVTDLLEREQENNTMPNTVMPIKAVDFTETKNTVRDIYVRMADYIELFRTTSANYMTDELLVEMFPALYTAIMHSRLDLPQEIFTNLTSFAINYLQQMSFFIRFNEEIDEGNFASRANIHSADEYYEAFSSAYLVPEICPWFENRFISVDEENEDFRIFANALRKHFEWDSQYNFYDVPNEILINTAYARLEEILKDYLIQ